MALATPGAMLGLAATSQPAASVLLILAAGTFGLARPPLFSGALNARIPSERRATVLSAVSAARTLAVAAVYLLVGPLADASLPLAFVVLGIAGLLAAVLLAAPRELLDAPTG